jgi:hypothetical protein
MRWWRATNDVQDVVHAILALINTSVGFAV